MISRLPLPKLLTLALIVFCASSSESQNNSNLQIGATSGEIAVACGAIVATAIIVPVAINHSHHNLQGCVYSTPSGLELRTEGQHTYALAGATANLSPGTTVHLHGDRQKHEKNSSGPQVFLVKDIRKTSGSCTPPSSPAPPTASSAPANQSHP